MKLQEPPIALPEVGATPVYFASLIAGLEPVVADELAERLPGARVLGLLRGRAFFAHAGDPSDTLGLMTVENIFGYVGQIEGIEPTEDGLRHIESAMAELDLGPALALHRSLHGALARPSFRITAARAGEHAFISQQVAAAAGAGVVERYGWKVDLEGYDLDVRVYVTQDVALVGLRLSPEALHRRARVAHGVASLNPTVAHAMCRLCRPTAGEVFVDPMCGAGTILIERARFDPARAGLLVGGDLFEDPLHLARQNLSAQGVRATLVRWDARKLPLARDCVDKIACNLPWGRRIGSHARNRHLYPAFMRHLASVLRPGGVAALLTQEKRLITDLIARHSWLELEEHYPLSVSGLHPTLYLVRKMPPSSDNRHPTSDIRLPTSD